MRRPEQAVEQVAPLEVPSRAAHRLPAAAHLGAFFWALCTVFLCACSDDAVAPPPTVPLDAADAQLVELIDELRRAAQSLPESAEMRGRLAMAFEVNDFDAAAIATYGQAAALGPDDFRWPYFEAVLTAEEGDTERALEVMDGALAIDGDYVPVWLYRGVWLVGLGRHAEARESFERARDLGARANGEVGIAQTLFGEGDAAGAVAILEPLSEELKHPHVYRLLGRAYRALGRSDEARIALARGRKGTPLQWRDPLQEQKWGYLASYGGRLVHAESLLRTERFAEAVEVLEPMRGGGVDDEAVLAHLSLAYGRSGQLERAFETLREGFAGATDHFRYHNVIASLHYEQGDLERAIDHLRRSVELVPKQTWPYERLGAFLMRREQYDEALAAFDKALEYGIEEPEKLLYTTGLLEGMAERWDGAVERLQRAVDLHAAFTKAYVALGRSLAEAGAFEEARDALEWAELLGTHPDEVASAYRRLDALREARDAGPTADANIVE